MRVHWAGIGLLLLAACIGRERPGNPTAPTFDVAVLPTVSGSVLGPDGTSICNRLADEVTYTVRAFAETERGWNQVALATPTCPVNTFALDVPATPVYLRVGIPGLPLLGTLPQFHLEPTPVDPSGGSATRDIRIGEGAALPGGASSDGVPFEGAELFAVFDSPVRIGAVSVLAGADGLWQESWGRTPPRLESGVRFWFDCPWLLGAVETSGPVFEPRLVPDEVPRLDCSLRSPSPATAYTHAASRLVATVMAGDLGGTSRDVARRFGTGWGVQFPVAPGTSPRGGAPSASHLYRGGLVIGVPPGTVLPAFDLCRYEFYWRQWPCMQLGADARGEIAHQGRYGRMITWRYSDASSARSVGLSVRQRSFDPTDDGDYVLVQYRFTNERSTPLTFYAGGWFDWDVNETPYVNVGLTLLDGHLVVVRNADGAGPQLGTYLAADAPIAGTTVYGCCPGTLTETELLRWVTGEVRQPEWMLPSDIRSVHTAGPYALAGHRAIVLWMALVAGDDEAQLLENAAKAQAAIAWRQAQAAPEN